MFKLIEVHLPVCKYYCMYGCVFAWVCERERESNKLLPLMVASYLSRQSNGK